MRVLCIDSSPIEGLGNIDLFKIKEGQTYQVLTEKYGGYYLGFNSGETNEKLWWNYVRFIKCEGEIEYHLTEEKKYTEI